MPALALFAAAAAPLTLAWALQMNMPTEVQDIGRVNTHYDRDVDEKCLRYLRHVASIPSWRRNGIEALACATAVSSLTTLGASSLHPVDALGLFVTAFMVTTICTFFFAQANAAFFADHILCNNSCGSRPPPSPPIHKQQQAA
jgi:hypothetical protein